MGAKAKQVAQNLKAATDAAKKNPTLGDIAGEALRGVNVRPSAETKKELDSLALPPTDDLDTLLSEMEQESERDAEIEAYKAEVTTRTEKCVKLAKVIGKLLADEEDSDFHKEKIGKAKSTVIEQLTGITRKGLQRQAAVAVAKTFFEALPANDRGVETLCDYVVAVGLMKSVQPAAAGCITVTYENEEGKQKFRYLVSGGVDVPLDVMKTFKEFVEVPTKALLEEKRRVKSENRKAHRNLRAGTAGNLLEVLASGGETVIPVYDKDAGEGELRIAVADGMITPVDVLGKYSELGNQMIDEAIAIPVSGSIGKERLELGGHEKSRERFQLMLKLHRAVNFWFAVLMEQKGMIEKAKATGKWVEPHAFVVEKKVGVTYLFVAKLFFPFSENRRPLRNVHVVLERREDGGIKVLWTGKHEALQDAFATNKEWRVPGQKNEGLGKVLARLVEFSREKLIRREKIQKRKEAARLAREAETQSQSAEEATLKPVSLDDLDDGEDDASESASGNTSEEE